MMSRLLNWLSNHIAFWIVLGVALLCWAFIVNGTQAENGGITLDGKNAKIEQYTEDFIKNANSRLDEMMNNEPATDEETINANNKEEVGLGFSTSIDQILGRRLPDGDNDNGNGWQCSKYTAYLATGRREYSSAHPDYGPVNGKDVADWLVRNYGFKYIDNPVAGAIGSGGFNTLYGHTVMFLYSTGANTAMVNDANYTPLRVATHSMNISGYKWVVPGDYTPKPTPTPTPTPSPAPAPAAYCESIDVVSGDTMGAIMSRCEGYIEYGEVMDAYAQSWFSTKVAPGQSVYDGWHSSSGVGLYAGDTIERR